MLIKNLALSCVLLIPSMALAEKAKETQPAKTSSAEKAKETQPAKTSSAEKAKEAKPATTSSAEKAKEAKPATTSATPSCKIDVFGTDQMTYVDKKTDGKKLEKIEVASSCKSFTIHLEHIGTLPSVAMGHNLFVVESANVNQLSTKALQAGPSKNYMPDDRSLVIAGSTKLLGGGATDTKSEDIVIKDVSKLKKGGAYSFFCSFPGHVGMMQGKLEVK